KNTLSDAAKFARGLCCLGNDLLNVLWYVSATISETPCPQPNFLVRNVGYPNSAFNFAANPLSFRQKI
ncbi:MAG: hypothetical protein JJU13_00750, partial [Balneolaceae bacterium]|nr:hypothetical protein [Balneolaceae bacterium]